MDLLGPVTRVQKKKMDQESEQEREEGRTGRSRGGVLLDGGDVLKEVAPPKLVIPDVVGNELAAHVRPVAVGKSRVVSRHEPPREHRQPCGTCE